MNNEQSLISHKSSTPRSLRPSVLRSSTARLRPNRLRLEELEELENKVAIESLSMDLLRTARGYHKGSLKMANRFKKEALKRCSQIQTSELRPHFVQVLHKIPTALSGSDISRIAEDALMYSTICKNYAKKFL